jgi:hypothetical protein
MGFDVARPNAVRRREFGHPRMHNSQAKMHHENCLARSTPHVDLTIFSGRFQTFFAQPRLRFFFAFAAKSICFLFSAT